MLNCFMSQAVFGLLWLEQYSLLTSYFDNSPSAFIGSLLARLAGLTLFVYAIRYALAKARISGDVRTRDKRRDINYNYLRNTLFY